MRVLWVGDAVVSTGFARCTHAACDALHAAGHEVHVLGMNYYGDPHGHPYRIYPCHQPLDGGHDLFGTTRLPIMAKRLKPDVICLLNDPWNVPEYLRRLGLMYGEDPCPPVVAWLAVDAKNQNGGPLNDLARVAVWTRFGADELKRGGYEGEPVVVPLGVDSELFRPMDRDEARARLFDGCGDLTPPPGAFVIGVVGRNQPRKRLDLTLEYFAEWVRTRGLTNAYLLLHVAPTGDLGVDIYSLAKYFEIEPKHLILAIPDVGRGVDDGSMPIVYNAMDVYLTTTQGEGWGLPALEAMACGVPVIAPSWSGLGDWAAPAAMLVRCGSIAPTAPVNGLLYTLGGVPDKKATLEALDNTYLSEVHRAAHSRRGRRLALTLPWSAAGEGMLRLLEEVVAEASVQGGVAAEAEGG